MKHLNIFFSAFLFFIPAKSSFAGGVIDAELVYDLARTTVLFNDSPEQATVYERLKVAEFRGMVNGVYISLNYTGSSRKNVCFYNNSAKTIPAVTAALIVQKHGYQVFKKGSPALMIADALIELFPCDQ